MTAKILPFRARVENPEDEGGCELEGSVVEVRVKGFASEGADVDQDDSEELAESVVCNICGMKLDVLLVEADEPRKGSRSYTIYAHHPDLA